MGSKEAASARIAVTRQTHQRLRDIAHGLGVSQDEAINILLDLIIKPGDDDLLFGRKLRKKLERKAQETAEASRTVAEVDTVRAG
jgi:antitoxin component of RelBE/YafQ-DinJ toxin-antitoxin module